MRENVVFIFLSLAYFASHTNFQFYPFSYKCHNCSVTVNSIAHTMTYFWQFLCPFHFIAELTLCWMHLNTLFQKQFSDTLSPMVLPHFLLVIP